MADISRNTTPAWQDPHLKDRGDYTEQDIQNIRVFCFNVCSTGSAVFFRSVG